MRWLLPLLLLTGCADLPSNPYTLYRANLHAHTRHSDSLFGGTTDLNPATAFEDAWKGGFDVLCVADHGEWLNPEEWALAKEQAAAVPEGFVGLIGFEWTATKGAADPSEHLPQFTRGTGHISILGSTDWAGVTQLEDGELRPDQKHKELFGFYNWIVENLNQSQDGGTIIGVFNHPSLYDASNHFAQNSTSFYFDAEDPLYQQLDLAMQLCEMGSYSLFPLTYYEGGGSGKWEDRDTSNEYWFRLALRNGWHLAPVNSGDNHLNDYAGRDTHTGIYARALTPREILEALRARRTFSSEDRNASLTMRARGVSQANWAWQGTRVELLADDTVQVFVQYEDAEGERAKVQLLGKQGVLWEAEDVTHEYVTLSWESLDEGQLWGERYVYAKATQLDGDQLYAAPCWFRWAGL